METHIIFYEFKPGDSLISRNMCITCSDMKPAFKQKKYQFSKYLASHIQCTFVVKILVFICRLTEDGLALLPTNKAFIVNILYAVVFMYVVLADYMYQLLNQSLCDVHVF